MTIGKINFSFKRLSQKNSNKDKTMVLISLYEAIINLPSVPEQKSN
jgi:hypothetical protein